MIDQNFEVLMRENISGYTLNPVEEGLAFRRDVQEFGLGRIGIFVHKVA
jgi:hypothetical protein